MLSNGLIVFALCDCDSITAHSALLLLRCRLAVTAMGQISTGSGNCTLLLSLSLFSFCRTTATGLSWPGLQFSSHFAQGDDGRAWRCGCVQGTGALAASGLLSIGCSPTGNTRARISWPLSVSANAIMHDPRSSAADLEAGVVGRAPKRKGPGGEGLCPGQAICYVESY